MLTKEQVQERTKYIGSSDAAAVLGLSRWKTRLEVWAEKTAKVPKEDISDRLPIEVGHELENLVAKLFMKRTGKTVHRMKQTVFHPNHPFIAANIDRRVVGEKALLECKTASGWKAKEWEGEEIPQEYIIQVLHQLAVTGMDTAYIACLIGGNQDFRWKTIRRDSDTMSQIIQKEAQFWIKYIEPKIMPDIITKNDGDILYKLFPMGVDEEAIKLNDEANALVESLEGYQEDLKSLEGQIDKTKNELKSLLKDHTVGLSDKYKVTWRNQVMRRVNTTKLKSEMPEVHSKYLSENKMRVLRFSKLKNKKKGD